MINFIMGLIVGGIVGITIEFSCKTLKDTEIIYSHSHSVPPSKEPAPKPPGRQK